MKQLKRTGSRARIDLHIHLAGSGCCGSGAYLAEKLRKRYTIRILRMLQGVSEHQLNTTFDRDWAERIAGLIESSAELDYGVILGFDGSYDHLHGGEESAKTQMRIPAKWVFNLCKEFPLLLPGPSINPHRKDALEQLEYCIDQRAVLIKWLPSAQNIDPAHQSLKTFYKRLADSGIPLLAHVGGEQTFYSISPHFNDFSRLVPALEAGVTVICAHSGTKVLTKREENQLPYILQYLNRYPHLYVDNSGICNPSRFAHLPKLAHMPELLSRTLYGSDWPVPSSAVYYFGSLPAKEVLRLQRIRHPLDRDVGIKRAFGIGEDTLTRAHTVLANLDYWMNRGGSEAV